MIKPQPSASLLDEIGDSLYAARKIESFVFMIRRIWGWLSM